MEAALRAIAGPTRRQILQLVWEDERSAGEIAAHFQVSWPAISQHLGVLKAAGLIEERREGRRRLYRTRQETVVSLRDFLEREWDQKLARLATPPAESGPTA